jgi:hypothetical protein
MIPLLSAEIERQEEENVSKFGTRTEFGTWDFQNTKWECLLVGRDFR